MIKIEGIKKKFTYPTEVEVLSGVSFTVDEGEIVAIMGPSGCGKSTLLYIIGSLEPPTEGSVNISQKEIGFVFQSFYLLEDYTTLENLLLPPWIARKSIRKGTPPYRKAEELLEMVGLEERRDFPTKLLSGGEKQRVGIARALMNDPLLILADEPTGNLDAKNGKLISELLLRSCREAGKSMILVTHDPSLAAACDRTLILQEGKIR